MWTYMYTPHTLSNLYMHLYAHPYMHVLALLYVLLYMHPHKQPDAYLYST